ncbi:MAG: putative aliphatic sulfonates transport permease protein SsuC, partial [Chlamydiae bacterium]|nr:putative aliphatic sulfonates transport permease protein SsuC [Chlamydiota bacterium]
MLKKVAVPFIGLLILLGVWEFSSQFFHSLLFILPAPSDIFTTLWESNDRLFFHTLVTFKEMAGGFLLALGIAFPLAWTMIRFKTSRLLLQPFFITIQCLPMFTLAPIMVIWFGWSYTAIVIPTALMIFFPLTLNIYQGLRSTPQELLDFFRSNQATPFQTLLKLRLPFATSHIFAGFRISAAIAGIGAVAGEWAGAEHGLGILMLESRRNADLEICFAALFCLTTMSLLLYSIVLGCERWFITRKKWKVRFAWRRISFKKRRFAFACFLVGTLLTGLVSCQNKSHHSTRLLLDWLPNPNHVPLYAGIDKGYFAEEGIFLKLQKMHDSGCGISYLTSRQADLLINHMPSIFKACERGAELKIVGLLVKQPVRTRLADSLEVALKLSDGLVIIAKQDARPPSAKKPSKISSDGWTDQIYSERYACPIHTEVSLPELSPRLFSFNSPYG